MAASEIVNGVESITKENTDLVIISSKKIIITFADAGLEATKGTLYFERLDLATMTSTTLTIENLDN